MTDLEMLEKMHDSAAAGLDIMRQALPISHEQYLQGLQELEAAYIHLQEVIQRASGADG